MLTNFLIGALAAYALMAAAGLLMVMLFGLPPGLDRATSYGDERLVWPERFMLAVFLPAGLFYAAYCGKWPGVRQIAVEFWVAIVLGRQPNGKD